MSQHKAKELADPLAIENFSVSNLWLDRLRIRNNIICRSLCGEAADVDPSSCEGANSFSDEEFSDTVCNRQQAKFQLKRLREKKMKSSEISTQ
ncbi:hypothetical protein AVEN_4450-1 [Araneus ventricosus]|uniref:HTH CENPB-type domain-containing protein n=1 Tax=Araneus ventricosus TaxID=182803 RepID=A0A4Y2PE13_ARAVE|nr:hypothetical protein AVEN_4450-1 [Araneus ventricosus]